MKTKLEFVIREVAGETLLVPVGKTALDLNGLLTLNEMGAEIWRRLPQAENEAALADEIVAEYDAPEAQIRQDVHEFLQKLRELDILE